MKALSFYRQNINWDDFCYHAGHLVGYCSIGTEFSGCSYKEYAVAIFKVLFSTKIDSLQVCLAHSVFSETNPPIFPKFCGEVGAVKHGIYDQGV